MSYEKINPLTIRFSQSTVSGNNGEKITDDFEWNELQYSPIVVVTMSDELLTSYDNRRIIRAINGKQLKIECLKFNWMSDVPVFLQNRLYFELIWESNYGQSIQSTTDNTALKWIGRLKCKPKTMGFGINLQCVHFQTTGLDIQGISIIPNVVDTREDFIYLNNPGSKIISEIDTVLKEFRHFVTIGHPIYYQIGLVSTNRITKLNHLNTLLCDFDLTHFVDVIQGTFECSIQLVTCSNDFKTWTDHDKEAYNLHFDCLQSEEEIHSIQMEMFNKSKL